MPPRVGLSCDSDDDYLAAARPLFAEGLVAALEYNIDNDWGVGPAMTPAWVERLLDLYAADGALYGHGVWLSFLTAVWQPRQEEWLERFAAACQRRPHQLISEHFGFLAGGPFARSTMLPVPRCRAAVTVGQRCLARLQEVAQAPCGVEVQANTLAPADASLQGSFMDAILGPREGFLLLDVHNIWTQAVNNGLDATHLLHSYPLHRVREIHISGGSWARALQVPDSALVRLDSHDGPLLPPVLALLREALAACPSCEVVIFERRGALDSEAERATYQSDYRLLVELVAQAPPPAAPPAPPLWPAIPDMLDEAELARYQLALLTAFQEEPSCHEALARLRRGPGGAVLDGYLQTFDLRMVELLSALARRYSLRMD